MSTVQDEIVINAPIDERDVLAMLVAAADARIPDSAADGEGGGHVLDATGPDVISYGELVQRIAELMLVSRGAINLPVSFIPVASVVTAVLTGEDPALVSPLMESLEADLLPNGRSAAEALSVRLHSLDAAIEHALGDWERTGRLAAR